MRLFLLLLACGAPQTNEPSFPLGGRGLSGYHVLAGAQAALPQGEIGFVVTADGLGGYLISWTGDAGASMFAGSATTDVGFAPNGTVKLSGSEDVTFTAADRIDFSGTPGVTQEGVQLMAQTEPIYLDLTVAGSHEGFGIFFSGARTKLVQASAFDPVAFTSP